MGGPNREENLRVEDQNYLSKPAKKKQKIFVNLAESEKDPSSLNTFKPHPTEVKDPSLLQPAKTKNMSEKKMRSLEKAREAKRLIHMKKKADAILSKPVMKMEKMESFTPSDIRIANLMNDALLTSEERYKSRYHKIHGEQITVGGGGDGFNLRLEMMKNIWVPEDFKVQTRDIQHRPPSYMKEPESPFINHAENIIEATNEQFHPPKEGVGYEEGQSLSAKIGQQETRLSKRGLKAYAQESQRRPNVGPSSDLASYVSSAIMGGRGSNIRTNVMGRTFFDVTAPDLP